MLFIIPKHKRLGQGVKGCCIIFPTNTIAISKISYVHLATIASFTKLPRMKKLPFFLIIACSVTLYCCAGCGEQRQKVITFSPLGDADFSFTADSSYSMPKGKMWDEKLRLHDSCMGTQFSANAMFIRKKDTFHLGAIVNKKTMKIVRDVDIRSFGGGRIMQVLDVITKPCYERMPIQAHVDSFFNTKITITLPGATETINRELNNTIRNSISTHMQMGSWLNAGLTNAFTHILDTATNAELLAYKNDLLDSNNVVLVKSSSITDFTFYINTEKPLSAELQAILKKKPMGNIKHANFGAQLFYLDDHSLELSFSGIFQVMGQFMKGGME